MTAMEKGEAVTVESELIDTHQHLWILSERNYDWITPEIPDLRRDFGMADVRMERNRAGITGTILVQAADTYEDTFYMLSVAAEESSVLGVVGWVPFDRTAEARAAIDALAHNPVLRGFRNLTHDYEDPRWILRADVRLTLDYIAQAELSLDMVTTNPEHNNSVIELADQHPGLTIIVDHMAHPDIDSGEWDIWATQVRELARRPNVFLKLSGLSTVSAPSWRAKQWQPYVDHALECFTPERMMLGSDWPVCLLAGDFSTVWEGQREALIALSPQERAQVESQTARRAYRLGAVSGAASDRLLGQ